MMAGSSGLNPETEQVGQPVGFLLALEDRTFSKAGHL
jgi:hypothetical protein